jgi:hypothetical protein
MGLFGPDSVPPNQLLKINNFFQQTAPQNYAFVNALPNQKATSKDKSHYNSRPLLQHATML